MTNQCLYTHTIIPVQISFFVPHLLSLSPSNFLQCFYLAFQPLWLCPETLCVQSPFCLPPGGLLTSRSRPVCGGWEEQVRCYVNRHGWELKKVDFISKAYRAAPDLAMECAESSVDSVPLKQSPCNIRILWFSLCSSRISCLAWAMVSHGLAGPESDGGVAAWVTHFIGVVPRPVTVPGTMMEADWVLAVKWDGGIRVLWLPSEKQYAVFSMWECTCNKHVTEHLLSQI